MTWANWPLAAIAAAIAIPALVILYFLKLRRRTVEVSTTLLWKKAIQDLQANAPFQRLRRNILLLLQLLILAAALLALAQPRSAAEVGGGRRLVMMIDRSASMDAIDAEGIGERTRLDLAKERALEEIAAMRAPELLGSAGDADEAMIIAFDAGAEILTQFTSDKAALRAAVESVTQTDGPSEAADAFNLAQAQRPRRIINVDVAPGEQTSFQAEGLVGGEPLEFHLFSDGRVDGLDQINPRANDIEDDDTFVYHGVGAPDAANIALIGLRAERGYEDPTRVSIYVGVQSTDTAARAVDIELGIDGDIAGIRTLALPAAEIPSGAPDTQRPTPTQSGVVFELERSQAFLASITLRTGSSAAGDVLSVDNAGWVIVPPARQVSVAVVTSGNLFITEALRGLPLSRLDTMSLAEYEVLAADGRADRYDVVVLDGGLPRSFAGGDPAPGRYVIFDAVPPPPFGLESAGDAGAAAMLDWSRTHPALRDVSLDGLQLARSQRVVVPEGSAAVVLAETTESPAIIELGSGDARAILAPFDLAQTNWPFDLGFVIFLASAIDYLGSDSAVSAGAGAVRRQFVPGDVVTTRLPVGVEEARLIPPGGEDAVRLVPAADGSVAYGPVRRAGLYQVRWSGDAAPGDVQNGSNATRTLAVNVLDPDESDVAAESEIILASSEGPIASRQRGQIARDHWPWLLLAALAIMLFEWWVYNRKVYV